MHSTTKESDAPLVKLSRILYISFAWFFMICIVLQVFFAGTATFVNYGDWSMHKDFVVYFLWMPIVMFLLSFSGGLKGWQRWMPIICLVMIVLQFLTVQVVSSAGIVAALHPVIAVLLFWCSVRMVKAKFT